MNNFINQKSYIDGRWYGDGELFSVINPANESEISKVYDVGIKGAHLAIDAANQALLSWQAMNAHQRAEILMRWYQLMMENQEALAQILTAEQGKPIVEARGEIAYSASFIQWFAEEGKRTYGDIIPHAQNGQRLLTIKQGVGVVAAITPWNFPSAMLMRKAAAALAAGCTFVGRPDPQTPFSALALAQLAAQAGIPNGVFNIVISQQAQAVGEVLTTHPNVAKISFTGSTRVGKILLAQASSSVKRVSMELGGNAPFIVFDDANIDEAVDAAIKSKYRNAGQTCICANRFFVHQHVVDEFTEKFVKKVAQLKVGDGVEESTDIGPMISSTAVSRVQALVEQSIAMGAEKVFEGQSASNNENFLAPIVLTNVHSEMPIANHEIFGPVSPILTFEDEGQAITLANSTEFGLAAYFFSENINRIWRVAERLEFGMIGINDSVISNAVAPFGGVKHSGFGREGSKYGLEDYQTVKYLCMGNIK